MFTLTPAERRAVLIVALLFAIGAGRDLWVAHHPRLAPPPRATATASPRAVDSSGAASRRRPRALTVDLNRADLAELDELPGVGPVLAGRIVEQRRLHGPFRRVEDLRAVRGIGPRLLERIRPFVTLNPRPVRAPSE